MYDINKIREDFPILSREVYGKPLIYLDNGATTQKPRQVVEAITNEYYSVNANVHRGVHFLSQQATELHEASRETVRRFINARSTNEIIFTRGTTESINLLASSFADSQMEAGDEVIVSTMEHHSNIVPWQLQAAKKGIVIKVIPMNDKGELLQDEYKKLFSERTKLVCVMHVSNVLGTVNPVKEMIAEAHSHGVPVLVDGAQSVPHMKVDVQDLDADFFAFSGHKVYGPTGVGVLYGKEEWLDKLPPYQGGGEMIQSVSFEKTTFNELPFKFEAGTPDYIGTTALAKALDYVSALGMDINTVEGENASVVGNNVPIASYGLPGTKKLRKGVIDAITRSDSKAAIMAHHGAVCMGTDYDDAFNVAKCLENICEQYILDKYTSLTGTVASSLTAINDYVVDKFVKKPSDAPEFPACKSERDGPVFNISVIDGDGTITRIDIDSGDIIAGDINNSSIELHRAVYKKRKDVNYIYHTKDPYTVACSKLGKTMRPLIDDFAQIVGVTVKHAGYNPNNSLATSKKVVKKLKGRNAVLLDNNGALCVAGSEYDAGAIEFITNKGAKIQVCSKLYGKEKPINPVETRIMNLVYRLKYSKQAGK